MREKICVANIGNIGGFSINACVYGRGARPTDKNYKPFCRKYFI